MLKKEQFLPAITTTDRHGNGWRAKIKEIKDLGLERVAIFPTCLGKGQREEMYGLLEETEIKDIPFVHIRGDMSPDELDYLIKRFGTRIFNIHPEKCYPFLYDYSKYKHLIYIENVWPGLDEEDLKQFAGICLDLSHLENDKRINPALFEKTEELLKKYPLGCNHISGISEVPHPNESGMLMHDLHLFENLSDFDYLKSYPKEYFSETIAMELANPLKAQLKVIDYILRLMN